MSNSTSASNILPIMEEGNDIQQNSSFSFLQQSMAVPSLVLSTIGFVTNILVIIVILCGSLRHSIFMSLLVVLAITDNLTLLASNLVQPGVFGHLFGPAVTVCRIFSFLMLSCGAMSSWTVVLVSVERYIAIFYPLKVHLYLTLKRIHILMCCLILITCTTKVYYLLKSHIVIFNGIPVCFIDGKNGKNDLILSIMDGLLYSFIPFCIITTLNLLILKRLKSHKTLHARSQHLPTLSTTRVNMLVSMMFAISIVFVVTTVPISILTIIINVFRVNGHGWDENNNLFLVLGIGLVNLNHIINFFLYCVTGSVFRGALFGLFKCRKRKHLGNLAKQQAVTSFNAL